jgi:hypothetical protein
LAKPTKRSKFAWTPEEDARLRAVVRGHRPRSEAVDEAHRAGTFPGRTFKAVLSRSQVLVHAIEPVELPRREMAFLPIARPVWFEDQVTLRRRLMAGR